MNSNNVILTKDKVERLLRNAEREPTFGARSRVKIHHLIDLYKDWLNMYEDLDTEGVLEEPEVGTP